MHLLHRRDSTSDFTGFFTKTLPNAFKEVGDAFQTGFHDIAFGLDTFDDWMKDTFAPDCLEILTAVGDLTLSILKFAGGFATALVDVVAYPVMEIIGPLIAPILEKIPGEEQFAREIGVNVPILSNFFDHLPQPPPPPPGATECLIKGNGNVKGAFTQAQLDAFKASMANGMTEFRREVTRDAICNMENLSDAEAATLTADFTTVTKHQIVPDEGVMSKDDKTYYLYTMCTWPEASRQAFLKVLSTWSGATQAEYDLMATQDYDLSQGRTPASCAPPPSPPMTIQQTIATGGGQGIFTQDELTTFKSQLGSEVSPFRAFIVRVQVCYLKGLSDSEAAFFNRVMATLKIVQLDSGCTLTSERPTLDAILKAECLTTRAMFVNALASFPNSDVDEQLHFNSTVVTLGCHQPSGCPAPTTTVICRASHEKRHLAEHRKDITSISQAPSLPCTLNGGGSGKLTPHNLATLRANIVSGLSPFAMNALHQQLCEVSGLSDSEVKELNRMLVGAPIITPRSSAMSASEEKHFLNQVPEWCAKERQDFLKSLRGWPTANHKEIQAFNARMQHQPQPQSCPTA
ncbi:hypothetical protein FRB98_004648 [Tulasnella sp. 332]|nr:hypothetical protein FRB98_004648 [Tulasnella sp. 332]